MSEVFISLTRSDKSIADVLDRALKQLIGEDILRPRFCYSDNLGASIPAGANWFVWILDRVRECDFALILLTPRSAHKPWILWETGALQVAAAATMASGAQQERKVRPLVFQLDDGQLPSPFLAAALQHVSGDSRPDVRKFFEGLLDQYNAQLGIQRFARANQQLDTIVNDYMNGIQRALRLAPMLPTVDAVGEWLRRLDALIEANRASEVEHWHHWIDIAFGREHEDQSQPIDLRIHARLAELYMKAKKWPPAIDQLLLVRRISPRDIFNLRTLGRAYLEQGDRQRAKDVIDAIQELDGKAQKHNAECAALVGRWHREGNNHEAAIEVFRQALDYDPNSHYLANLLAEAQLEADRLDDAKKTFQRVVKIIEASGESNLWTRASCANAHFALGDDGRARALLAEARDLKPDPGSLGSIERGLRKIAGRLENGNARVEFLLATLKP